MQTLRTVSGTFCSGAIALAIFNEFIEFSRRIEDVVETSSGETLRNCVARNFFYLRGMADFVQRRGLELDSVFAR